MNRPWWSLPARAVILLSCGIAALASASGQRGYVDVPSPLNPTFTGRIPSYYNPANPLAPQSGQRAQFELFLQMVNPGIQQPASLDIAVGPEDILMVAN